MYRKATLQDCAAVYDLICDMEQKKLPYEKFSAIFRHQLGNMNYYCLVCEQENNVCGVLNMRMEEQLHHAETIAEILEFAVGCRYRDKGIGKEMLEAACQIAKEKGCTQIEVACNTLRSKAHRFYEREGMHKYHFRFSKILIGQDTSQNKLGR